MDGITEDEELPRYEKEFSRHQVQLVQRLRRQGCSNAEIARKLGLTTAGLLWQLKKGKFGKVEPRQGLRPNSAGKPLADCERSGRCFGTTTWKARQEQIRDSWDESEAKKRQAGDLPNSADNYHRFRRK